MDQAKFSHKLIKEYQQELYETYGVFVDEAEAQVQLGSLVRSMFPSNIAVNCAESREQGARVGDSRPCAGSLSAKIAAGGRDEVGASITPTSGRKENKYE